MAEPASFLDVAEHSMLNYTPFIRVWRKMLNMNDQFQLCCQELKLPLTYVYKIKKEKEVTVASCEEIFNIFLRLKF